MRAFDHQRQSLQYTYDTFVLFVYISISTCFTLAFFPDCVCRYCFYNSGLEYAMQRLNDVTQQLDDFDAQLADLFHIATNFMSTARELAFTTR